MKKALITGIAGQDGSYLAESLVADGYEVHGIVSPGSMSAEAGKLWRLSNVLHELKLYETSIENAGDVLRVVETVRPDECYHLAAHSFVSYSFEDQVSIYGTNINGTLNIVSAIRRIVPGSRFYYAGSSEMFGLADESPQTEKTRFNPRAPYGISKVAGFQIVRNYRESYGLFAVSGILFNHESERRGEEFVTRKITSTAARIKCGLADELRLGNLDARRDWGYAPDYVRAMRLMLRQDTPEDFVIATGVTHTVREFVEKVFGELGLDWRKYVVVDDKFYRPSERHPLCGDCSNASNKLGWKPTVGLEDMIRKMVDADMARIRGR